MQRLDCNCLMVTTCLRAKEKGRAPGPHPQCFQFPTQRQAFSRVTRPKRSREDVQRLYCNPDGYDVSSCKGEGGSLNGYDISSCEGDGGAPGPHPQRFQFPHRGRPSQELHGQNEAGKMCNVYTVTLMVTTYLRAKERAG